MSFGETTQNIQARAFVMMYQSNPMDSTLALLSLFPNVGEVKSYFGQLINIFECL